MAWMADVVLQQRVSPEVAGGPASSVQGSNDLDLAVCDGGHAVRLEQRLETETMPCTMLRLLGLIHFAVANLLSNLDPGRKR